MLMNISDNHLLTAYQPMADATGMSYGNVCLAALIPAVLYYLTLSVSVLAYSHKHRIPVKEKDPNEETAGQIFKQGWFFFLPIGSW